jgi:hypothetical protein
LAKKVKRHEATDANSIDQPANLEDKVHGKIDQRVVEIESLEARIIIDLSRETDESVAESKSKKVRAK